MLSAFLIYKQYTSVLLSRAGYHANLTCLFAIYEVLIFNLLQFILLLNFPPPQYVFH